LGAVLRKINAGEGGLGEQDTVEKIMGVPFFRRTRKAQITPCDAPGCAVNPNVAVQLHGRGGPSSGKVLRAECMGSMTRGFLAQMLVSGSEQYRSASLVGLSDDDVRVEFYFSLFQIL
jgi:hypothetical protein